MGAYGPAVPGSSRESGINEPLSNGSFAVHRSGPPHLVLATGDSAMIRQKSKIAKELVKLSSATWTWRNHPSSSLLRDFTENASKMSLLSATW